MGECGISPCPLGGTGYQRRNVPDRNWCRRCGWFGFTSSKQRHRENLPRPGSGLSEPRYGTRSMARCRVRTRWAQSALRLSRPTHYRLVCFGRIATAMPICAPHGFAPAMMYSEIWLSFLLRLASLAPAQAGRILMWQPSWLAWLCREPGLWFGSPSRNYISGYRSLRNRTRCAPRRGTRWRQQTVLYHWRAGCVVLVCALYNAIAREALAARLGLLPFLGQAD